MKHWRKLSLFLFGMVVAGTATVVAFGRWWPQAATKPLPVAMIERDLGDLTAGKKVSQTISIPNPTNGNLSVSSIWADCSCVSKTIDPEVIPPGGEAKLIVEYTTQQTPGPFSHAVSVSFDESSASTTVMLRGVVAAWLASPIKDLDFGELLPGETVNRDLFLETREPWPVAEQQRQLLFDNCAFVQNGEAKPENCLTLAFSPPISAEFKKYRGELKITWIGHEDRIIRVPCIAEVVSPWTASPKTIVVGIVAPGATKQFELNLDRRKGANALSEPKLSLQHDLGDRLKLQVIDESTDRARVKVDFYNPDENRKRGLVEGRIRISRADGFVVAVVPVLAFSD